MKMPGRAGHLVLQPTGYRAFMPAPLPPEPPIEWTPELARLLSEADRELGRLDGVGQILPDPDLFNAMYVRREAVLSSEIEGTQSTLDDLLAFELTQSAKAAPRDVVDVVNYVAALKLGLARLEDLPMSLRLTRLVHERLMLGVRGADKQPGEFRSSQNWIGGSSPGNALFVPPPPYEVPDALSHLERYWHEDSHPVLLQCALAHAQFETIHPFLDGNGRVGRLLITFFLMWKGVLHAPLLYLSLYLKRHRSEYYGRLQAVRTEGDWEGWVTFFLTAVAETAREATATARAIVDLREKDRLRMEEAPRSVSRALDLLFHHPFIDGRTLSRLMEVTFATATKAIAALHQAGILREATGQSRNRMFVYDAYLDLLRERHEVGLSSAEILPLL